MLTCGIMFLHNSVRLHIAACIQACSWSISAGSCLAKLLMAAISLQATTTSSLPEVLFEITVLQQ
jgi:hypothetical protein